MPSQAELTLVIEAQDRASAQLRSLSQEVARFERQVQSAGGGRGGGLLGNLVSGAGIGAAVSAIQTAARGVQSVFDAVGDSIFTQNSRLEQAVASYQALTGSASRAAEMLQIVRQEAGRGFDLTQLQEAGRSLVVASAGSVDTFRQLIDLSEQLAATDPAQGIQSAAFAIREALSGDFQSLIERFEASRASITRWREQGLPNLEVVARAITQLGGSQAAVDRLGQTFESRTTAVRNFADELRGLLGAGVFERISDAFARAVQVIADHGDRLRRLAADVGQAIGGILQGALNGLAPVAQRVLEMFAPGLWDQITASWQRLSPEIARATQALEEAAPAAKTLERQLGELGVGAAERQLQADRLRAGYEDQIRPLERQIELLRNSADLQRIAAGLASTRAQSERQRLQAELEALNRAGAAGDPFAPDLTQRQRAIALAAQERRLQLEQLDLTEQQRPALQSLEQQRDALRRAQEDALAPLERALAVYRDQAAELQIQRQRTALLKEDLEAAAEAQRKLRQQAGAQDDPAEVARRLEEARQRGEDLAKSWLKGFNDWIEAGGGTLGGAITKSLEDWWKSTGQPMITRLGESLGAALGTAAVGAFETAFGPRLQAIERFVAIMDEINATFTQSPAGRNVPGIVDEARRRRIEALPRLSPEGAGPNTLTGGGAGISVAVNVAPGAVQGGGLTPAQVEVIAQAHAAQLADALAAAAAGADPGPNRLLPGNVR